MKVNRILTFMGILSLLLSCGATLADSLCLPSNLVIIDAEAFAYDDLIREVILPEGTQRIETKAFANRGLTRIYLPSSLEYIAPDAFEGSSQDLTAWGESNAVYPSTYCAEHNIPFKYDKSDESEEGTMTMKMMIGMTTVPVEWEENESVVALKALCPLTIDMSMYGGFEQVGSIGVTLPRNDKQTTTSAGDIVLYSGNQLVVFYGSNSWAYTRLGHIDLSPQEMSELLSNGNVTIQAFLNEFAGASKSTITLCVGILKNIFSCAYAEGIIPRDPSVALVRPKSLTRNERRPLTPDETKRILHIARNHPDGLLLAVLYYTGVRRGEALGLKWGDFDFTEDQVHVQRDIDFTGPTAQEGALKTAAADRYIPIPPELKELLLKKKGPAGEYVFKAGNGKPLSQATFKRIWCRLMLAADCVEWREKKPNTSRENDILKCIKPIITPHYFRHNYITLLYEAGVDPLIAMKIAGHSDYQTTASVYTHIRDEMLKKSTVNMDEVFRKREE